MLGVVAQQCECIITEVHWLRQLILCYVYFTTVAKLEKNIVCLKYYMYSNKLPGIPLVCLTLQCVSPVEKVASQN